MKPMTTTGRILSLDVGDKRIGVAVTDPLRITAQPHSVIQRLGNTGEEIRVICRLLKELNVTCVVVGLPVNNRGEKGHQAEKVLQFVEQLQENTDIKIVFEDERYSTAVVERTFSLLKTSRARRKETVDSLAAQQILETYLSKLRRNEFPQE